MEGVIPGTVLYNLYDQNLQKVEVDRVIKKFSCEQKSIRCCIIDYRKAEFLLEMYMEPQEFNYSC